jgi:hypothetical protein
MKATTCISVRHGVVVLLLQCLATVAAGYESATPAEQVQGARQFTFAWPFMPGDSMAPRGGTTTGDAVNLAIGPGERWAALREPGLSARERDRRAILAMAGPYRASFDFIETVGFTDGYAPAPPYQSWGTEYVYVIADEPDFISLQHIMVIRFAGEDEGLEPVVMKHWRQDWRYEGRELDTFRVNLVRSRDKLSRDAARGRWVQSVNQVDDSPRYTASGTWEHRANYSSWTSDETWRPLPRREFSVRDDYDVLIGTNRHTITPTGWVHEQHNLKVVLDQQGEFARALARENGLARYERIEGFDWSPADAYWARTAPYWAVVREQWERLFDTNNKLEVRKTSDEGVPMFMAIFELADTITQAGFDAKAVREQVQEVLGRYVAPGTRGEPD